MPEPCVAELKEKLEKLNREHDFYAGDMENFPDSCGSNEELRLILEIEKTEREIDLIKKEIIKDSAMNLLRSVLLRVSWETCKMNTHGIFVPTVFDEAIEDAAKVAKENGMTWEELT